MRFAYHATMCNPDFYLPLAKAAEECGFDTFTFPDSICYPQECNSKYPYNEDGSREFLDGVPFLEPFAIIPAMGAITETLEFSTSVYKLAPREPVAVAKFMTSVAYMTNNRLHFGVGLSPWYEDFLATSSQWEKRGKRLDEQLQILRGLMSGEYFSFKGEFYDIPAIKLCPVPSKPVPLLIGGHSKPALKRAGQLADGWISAGVDLPEMQEMMGTIDEHRKEAGRDHEFFDFQVMTALAYEADGVKQLEDMGVNECVIGFRNSYEHDGSDDDRTLEGMIGEMQWFAGEVIAKVK